MNVPNAFEYLFSVFGSDAARVEFGPLYNYSTAPFGSAAGPGFSWPHRGQIRGAVLNVAGEIRVDVYGGGPAIDKFFLRGVMPGLGVWADMAPGDNDVNGTGAAMRFRVTSHNLAPGQSVPFVLIPTLADDTDVHPDPQFRRELPGYDDGDNDITKEKGLAYWLAKAWRQIITVDLPSLIPNKFAATSMGRTFPEIMGLVADPVATALPDIRTIAAVDQIRAMQAKLALYLSADSQRNQKEFADLADAAMVGYREMMDRVRDANAPVEEDAADEDDSADGGGIAFTSFTRG